MAPLIEKNKYKIISTCLKHNLKYLYLFGSAARETDFTTESDIDFLYAFDKEKIQFDNYADNYFAFRFTVEDLLKRNIDLVPEERLTNPYLIKSINRDKIKIYGEGH
ncbi:MAG TPA: nucleotidyltransferase domain-containing protein [Segetibacter sp.]